MKKLILTILALLVVQITLSSCSSPEPSQEEKLKKEIEQLQRQQQKTEQDLARIHYWSGLLASIQLEYEEAEKEYREAVRLAPDNQTYRDKLEEVQKILREKSARADTIQ